MTANSDNNPPSNEAKDPWYQAAVGTAIVAGLFSLIVLGFLVQNYLMITIYDAARTEKLEAMKIAIRDTADEELMFDIRQLDLQIRQNRIRRLTFSRKGGYLLFAGVVIFLLALKWASSVAKKPPSPQLAEDSQGRLVRESTLSRWAVAVGLVILASGAIFLTLAQRIDFTGADRQDNSYASMEEISKNWAGFRGPGGSGISTHRNVPTNWNGKTGEGIVWKAEVPLPGHNSPIVWENRVFVSGADPNKREVYCFDASSGKLLWQGTVKAVAPPPDEPLELGKETSYAAPTMVTDGRRVCAIFPNGDVGCFDFEGKQLWSKNLGTPDSAYGYTSSLALYKNLLLIQYDQGDVEDEKSKLIALKTFSGRIAWQVKRPVPGSWASPIVADVNGQYRVITCGDPWVIAYDPNNGAELWRAECLGGDVAPSPIYVPHQNRPEPDLYPDANKPAPKKTDFRAGLIFAIEPYGKLVAIRPDGRGDVTKTHIAWSVEDSTPDICSPVSTGELIFLLTTDGLLICYKVADGKKLWEEDLRMDFLASPSLVGDRLYLLSGKGVMFIVAAGAEYKELGKCELGEDCCASPAFADGRIYIRGEANLYCIGK